ncbi:MAG: phosphodiester glycosidase family protein [Candidatus Elarobacter sp.]
MTPNASAAIRVARSGFRSLYSIGLLLVLAGAQARAAALPVALAPPPPFPLVTESSAEREPVAPGVERAVYRLLTSAGPLVVSVVTVDPKEPTMRLGTMLAHDTVVSKDETVSAMAHRSGAVAGINGDYFDINNSGAPVGLLVRDGNLDRTPSARVALTVTRDRRISFQTYRFAGTASSGAVQIPLSGVNEWPPRNGAVLLTPSFGVPPPTSADPLSVLELFPLAGDPAGAKRYRVGSVTSAPPYPGAAVLRIAYGGDAQGYGPLPDVGDVVTLSYDTDPPLGEIAAAIGGGPALLRGGLPVDDPGSPNYADRDKRIPASAAALLADGTLALVVVDGRHPATSIGVDRAELIALLRGLGATDAMLFDSGGSATLAARVLGDSAASVVNEPSDGIERPVADGLFVYSDAPVGPPARLVVRPARIVALAGARVPLRAKLVDRNLHGVGDARGAWQLGAPPQIATIDGDDVLHAGSRLGSWDVHVSRGGVSTQLPLDVVGRVARLVVGPVRANPDPHATVGLTLAAFDLHDRPVAVDGVARWTAANARIDSAGRLAADERDAIVTASAGGASATVTIPVGRHSVPVALGDGKHPDVWRLVTAPANGPGTVALDGDRLQLSYDFGSGERAAYAVTIPEIPLGEPLALSCAVDGDGNGEALRATLVDRYGDRETVTFARTVDFNQTRRLNARVPAAMAPPIVLRNIYAVGTLANPPVTAAGALVVHDCSELVPGAGASAAQAP